MELNYKYKAELPEQRAITMQKFKKVEMEMEPAERYGYGHYYVKAYYRGKEVIALTTNSEAWDYFNDESDKGKHRDALRHCYDKIVMEYNN